MGMAPSRAKLLQFSFLTQEVVQLCFQPDGAPLGIKLITTDYGEISFHAKVAIFFGQRMDINVLYAKSLTSYIMVQQDATT